MPPLSKARLRRVEKILAADINAARTVGRLEKIATNEAEHPARRARAYDKIWAAWRAAALATPAKAPLFWERARIAAAKAEELRPKPSEIIRARLEAIVNGAPMPAYVPDPDAKSNSDNQAAREVRQRLDKLAATMRNDLH